MTSFKRISLFLVFVLAVPLFAAEAEQNFAGDGVQLNVAAFPRVSLSQDRQPLKISTTSHYPCGWTADLPSNCRWACYPNGEPVLDANGEQTVRCRPRLQYPEEQGGTCNRYYSCRPFYPGAVCDYSGGYFDACIFLEGNNGCTACNP